MASEFYEQLGIDRTASSARIRQAYGQACARLAKRRRALVEQGGSTGQLDLQRTRLDEAWVVLADPLRRRRYDAMLGWAESGRSRSPDEVWSEVGEALVHPAAAVAAKLLRVTARLTEIGQLPLAPSGAAEDPETLVPHEDDLTIPRAARLGKGRADEVTSPRLTMPKPTAHRSTPPSPEPVHRELLDLAPHPTPPPALTTPAPASRQTPGPSVSRAPAPPRVVALADGVITSLVDEFGYSGRLLAAVRTRMGLSVQDVADHTRISLKYLEALEGEVRTQLPSSTFVRGYVREVARLYLLEVDAVVAGYMRRFDG